MQIVELKLDELTPFENNTKIHTDKDVDVIIKRWETLTGLKAELL